MGASSGQILTSTLSRQRCNSSFFPSRSAAFGQLQKLQNNILVDAASHVVTSQPHLTCCVLHVECNDVTLHIAVKIALTLQQGNHGLVCDKLDNTTTKGTMHQGLVLARGGMCRARTIPSSALLLRRPRCCLMQLQYEGLPCCLHPSTLLINKQPHCTDRDMTLLYRCCSSLPCMHIMYLPSHLAHGSCQA